MGRGITHKAPKAGSDKLESGTTLESLLEIVVIVLKRTQDVMVQVAG